MTVATKISEVRQQVKDWKRNGLTVGLVPTMGYLHEGHASLIKTSVEHCDKTVVSVFLNPTQFAPNEDLESYPRNFDNDKKLCEEMGADLVFHPEVSEMYDEDSNCIIHFFCFFLLLYYIINSIQTFFCRNYHYTVFWKNLILSCRTYHFSITVNAADQGIVPDI